MTFSSLKSRMTKQRARLSCDCRNRLTVGEIADYANVLPESVLDGMTMPYCGIVIYFYACVTCFEKMRCLQVMTGCIQKKCFEIVIAPGLFRTALGF